METNPHNDSNEKKKKVIKEPHLAIISIAVTIVTTLIAVFLEFYEPPQKENKVVVDNRVGGKNQIAVRQLAPVKSFVSYLNSIENKDSLGMWDQSSEYRRKKQYHDNVDEMMYDYFLTNKYEVQYIIPKAENNQYSLDGPSFEENRSFAFYAILRFEDDVSITGEVDKLKGFNTMNLEQLRDSTFENTFNKVLDEVCDFIKCRFVVDSSNSEYVRSELRDYMMKMSMQSYITQDWRFPVVFARKLGLQRKKDPKNLDLATHINQGHTMLCNIVMIEEDSVWKVNEFRTVALSRWENIRNN